MGGKSRIRHGFERTAAMDVFNSDDRWSCYCHRCHEGGVVFKEHQRVRRAVVEPDRVQPVPAGCFHITDASRFESQQIWDLLIQKGCPPGVIPEEELWYDRTSRRVLMYRETVALGRALDPNRLPKWLPYGAWSGAPMVWTTRDGAGGMVLVEDALSGYKVAKAIELLAPRSSLAVVAILGTRISDRFLPYCMGRRIICMFDGDSAGARGYTAVRRRLGAWGNEVHNCAPSKGDPKNMELGQIIQRLEDFVWTL